MISNTGDYGHFAGMVRGDSFALAHFDGSFVYLLTGELRGGGDTLRGIFHAGQRTQTPWLAVRSTGAPHLKSPTDVTTADTTGPFRFAFPDLDGQRRHGEGSALPGQGAAGGCIRELVSDVSRLRAGAGEALPQVPRRGLEIVGLAYEVTGDTAVDGRQVRRYRDKFSIPFPLLLAGVNDTEAAAATLPQLHGFTSFPTTVFIGRDGRVRQVHAGFYGPATGAQHERLIQGFEREIERLLAEPAG